VLAIYIPEMAIPTFEILLVGFIIVASTLVLLFPWQLSIYLTVSVAFVVFDVNNLTTLKLSGWLLWLVIPPTSLMNMIIDSKMPLSEMPAKRASDDVPMLPETEDSVGFALLGTLPYLRDVFLIVAAIIATTAGTEHRAARIVTFTTYAIGIVMVNGGRYHMLLELVRIAAYLITYRLIYVMVAFRHELQPCVTAWLASGWILFVKFPAILLLAIPLGITFGRHRLILQRRHGMSSGDLCALAEPAEMKHREHPLPSCECNRTIPCCSTSSEDEELPETGRGQTFFLGKEHNLMATAMSRANNLEIPNSFNGGIANVACGAVDNTNTNSPNSHNNHSQFIVINQVTHPTITSVTVNGDSQTSTNPMQPNTATGGTSIVLSPAFEDRIVAMINANKQHQKQQQLNRGPSIGFVRSNDKSTRQ
jgi:hypothetical protein